MLGMLGIVGVTATAHEGVTPGAGSLVAVQAEPFQTHHLQAALS